MAYIKHNDEVKKIEHLLAHVSWYQDHLYKFHLGNGLLLLTTVPELPPCSTFVPVSHIMSRCAIQYTKMQFDYGEDSVCVVIPLKRYYLF